MYCDRDNMLRLAMILLTVIALILLRAGDGVSAVIDADCIRSAVNDSVLAAAERLGLDVEVSVPYASNISVAEADSPVFAVKVPDGSRFGARLRTIVTVMNDSREPVRQLTVIAHVRSFAAVAVASGDISRGDPITDTAIVIERRDVTGAGEVFSSPKELEGMQAKWRIRSGRIVTGKMVEAIPVVRRGDRVTVRLIVGSVELTTKGTARENGGMHEVIRVYNETTRKTLRCTIIDSGTVIVGTEGG